MKESFQDDLLQRDKAHMTGPLNMSLFGTMTHDEDNADLMKLLKRLASKRLALIVLQDETTGLLKATAFGTSDE